VVNLLRRKVVNIKRRRVVNLAGASSMSSEHEFAGCAIDRISVLTNNYSLPEDACNTYEVTLKLLKQFEEDLHIHVHFENNILYPKALRL
jgi:regulator of cell morphogenesis and NO signaling